MIAAQHTSEGLLKFILPDDMVTIDLEVMTLTGVHVYRKDRNCGEKRFFPWGEENTPPQEFLRKVREPQGKEQTNFRITLEPSFSTQLLAKSPCKCPNFAKLVSKHKAPNSDSSQDKHVTTDDNISVMVAKIPAQKWPRKQQTQKKINVRSNWSDSDDDKDSQARGKPYYV